MGEDLHVSCTMPSIEVGTVGGGTSLTPQVCSPVPLSCPSFLCPSWGEGRGRGECSFQRKKKEKKLIPLLLLRSKRA